MLAKETILVLRVAVLFLCSASSLNAVPVANVTEEPVTTSSPKVEAGFIPSSAPLEANSTESVNKRAGRYTNNNFPVRKFDKNSNGGDSAVPGDYPLTAVINHYHGDLDNSSAQAINYYPAVQPEDTRLEKPPRLYYGDYARRPAPPSLEDGPDYMEADDVKTNEAERPQYYYPKNLPSKTGYVQDPREHGPGSKRGRPHGHSSNAYNSYADHQTEDQANQPGQTQLHGQISVSAGVDAHPFPHHHHHHAVHPHHGYRDYGHQHGGQYYHANPIGPVIGRALQLLIPSALLFTGASALFPNRIHVPTNNDAPAQKRSKRSAPIDRSYNYDARSASDDIPSQYLRPEHRSDDEGIPLYEDDDEDIFEPSSPPSFGERTPVGPSFATPMPSTSQGMDTTPASTTTSIPIIKANKLVPAEDIEALEFEMEQQNIKKLNVSSPEKNKTESRTSPMEVMSKILMASVSSSDISALKKPVSTASTNSNATSYSSVVPQVRRYDTSITTNEKPFFRQLSSTHAPRIVIVTPLTNSVREDDSAKVVQRREVEQDKSKDIDLSSGPPIVTLGGESEGNNGTVALNRTEGTNEISDDLPDIDLSPDSPVVGLLTNYAAREEETPACQKRALCELAMRGSKEGATKFERFLWNLANLVPPSLSVYYDLQDTFAAIQHKKCASFVCANPNLDLQDPSSQ